MVLDLFLASRRFVGCEDTYVADVKGAGASSVKFDEYFLRWDALMEVDSCDFDAPCRTALCKLICQEEKVWFQAQGCGEGLAALTADGMEKEFLAFRWLHFALPTGQ